MKTYFDRTVSSIFLTTNTLLVMYFIILNVIALINNCCTFNVVSAILSLVYLGIIFFLFMIKDNWWYDSKNTRTFTMFQNSTLDCVLRYASFLKDWRHTEIIKMIKVLSFTLGMMMSVFTVYFSISFLKGYQPTFEMTFWACTISLVFLATLFWAIEANEEEDFQIQIWKN